MQAVVEYLRNYSQRQHVRPWALAGPVLVLLICLPLLHPLRHPDPRNITDEIRARFATIQAMAEQGSLAIDPVSFAPDTKVFRFGANTFANQPPVMAFLLSGPYWVMWRSGLSFDKNPAATMYVLTLLAATLPAAGAAGLMYRMGRMFELRRMWRVGLGISVVLGTGLLPFAVVLNPHAPAAVLVMSAVASLIHISRSKHPDRGGVWLVTAGFCAALAAALEPSAVVFLGLFMLVIPVMRWTMSLRAGGVLLYLMGAGVPIALHLALTLAMTGQFILPNSRGQLVESWEEDTSAQLVEEDSEDMPDQPPEWQRAKAIARQTRRELIGRVGLFSHYPILVMGLVGAAGVCRRHWPATVKALAGATVIGAAGAVLLSAGNGELMRASMYSNRWLVVIGPMVLYWSGAWLRRSHRPLTWGVVVSLLVLSIGVSLIGAADPCPPGGFKGYTPIDAIRMLVS